MALLSGYSKVCRSHRHRAQNPTKLLKSLSPDTTGAVEHKQRQKFRYHDGKPESDVGAEEGH